MRHVLHRLKTAVIVVLCAAGVAGAVTTSPAAAQPSYYQQLNMLNIAQDRANYNCYRYTGCTGAVFWYYNAGVSCIHAYFYYHTTYYGWLYYDTVVC